MNTGTGKLKGLFDGPLLLVVLSILLSLIGEAAFAQSDVTFHEQLSDISLSIPSEFLSTSSPITCSSLKLKWGTVTVHPGQTVVNLLRNRGIQPNNDALGLLYTLNPTLMNTDAVKTGSVLLLPGLGSGAPTDLRVSLHVDAQLKLGLRKGIDSLQASTAFIVGLPDDRFHAPGTRLAVANEILNGLTSLAVLRGDEHPVSRTVIDQTEQEVRALEALLETRYSGSDLIGPEVLDLFKGFVGNWKIRSDEIKSGRRGSVHLSIRTFAIRKDERVERHNYEVFWVQSGIFDLSQHRGTLDHLQGHPLGLSSPTHPVPIASGNYRFWARRHQRSSNYQLKEIRCTKEVQVEIKITVPWE